MKQVKNISILSLLIFLFFACTIISKDGKKLARAVKSEVTEISPDALKSMRDAGEEFLLLDIRQPAEYEAGNIPGSFSIPRGELEFLINDDFFWEEQFMYYPLKTDRIILYCRAGDRSTLAAYSLKKLGFDNVCILKKGWIGFVGENPTITGQPDTGSGGGC